MKKLAAIGALGLFASCLFGQGFNTGGQTKEDWEEINFEFNSSILSDGYPSLLRLADLLTQHREYRVKVTGHTDYVGSAPYNDKLALRRAEAVKAFLVKYGASPDQITTAGDGKRAPEVDNRTKEGRFMNRRVVMMVTDGQGRVIKEGGIGDILNALQDFMKKQEECCAQILKRLDKLDDILAALKALQGDNDRLKGELADLRNQHNMLRDQVGGLPKPLSAQETQNIAHTEAEGAAKGALDEAQRRNRKFSLLGLNIGPTFGPARQGDFTFSGRGQFFSPFGGDGTQAVEAQGEYLYYPGRKEGQFDLGLVKRWGNVQAGGFASVKWLDLGMYKQGGSLGQAAFLLDYVFNGGRIGAFVTRGFKNYAVLNSITLAPGAYLQTYARVVNQQGVNFLFNTWGDAHIEGDLAYLQLREVHKARPGANLTLVQPVSEHIAVTVGGAYNESLVAAAGSGEVKFGLQVGNFIKPSDYAKITSPIPMDVPRIRYEIGTRRVGASPPVADAGPNQLGVPAGTITLNGSGSSDPLGETLTYQWTQIAGPSVAINNSTSAIATFTAAQGTTYSFRLTVRNTDNLSASATTTVSTSSPLTPTITLFSATPATIQPGGSSTLTWATQNATSVTITPTVGSVSASGSSSVTPAATTTYTLNATGPGGTVSATVTVVVGPPQVGNPQIIRFEANPVSIAPGGSSTLSWTTTGASTVTIAPTVGNVTLNGSTTVTPTQTTTYTLTATSSDGHSVSAPVTVVVAPANIPQILTFVANPQTIDAGQSTQLCWQVSGAGPNIPGTNIQIDPGVGTNLNSNDCAVVKPSVTTTYTLTATNATGSIKANVTVNVGAVRITSFTANPVTSTAAGNPVVLSWTTENASSVVLVGSELGPQSLPVNGSFTVNPITNSIYTLTAYGPGGQTVSVTISVFVR
ncbi:MAG TPA: OmpA family protein [Bryobacteraceae bacterium]|nr:OmpA family protein [Bryobacteraceae bacterium]